MLLSKPKSNAFCFLPNAPHLKSICLSKVDVSQRKCFSTPISPKDKENGLGSVKQLAATTFQSMSWQIPCSYCSLTAYFLSSSCSSLFSIPCHVWLTFAQICPSSFIFSRAMLGKKASLLLSDTNQVWEDQQSWNVGWDSLLFWQDGLGTCQSLSPSKDHSEWNLN